MKKFIILLLFCIIINTLYLFNIYADSIYIDEDQFTKHGNKFIYNNSYLQDGIFYVIDSNKPYWNGYYSFNDEGYWDESEVGEDSDIIKISGGHWAQDEVGWYYIEANEEEIELPKEVGSKVAIVGNSIAANFSYFNKIDYDLPDTDKHCAWITNHAVGGDGWVSLGLPSTTTYEGIGKVNKGYGKGFITRFTQEANKYDCAILINGSNELGGQYNSKPNNPELTIQGYVGATKTYLDQVVANNPNLTIIFYLIPHAKDGSSYAGRNSYIDVWNLYLEQFIKDNYPQIYIEKFENIIYGKNDSLHFSKDYYLSEWQRLKNKYNISE